MNEVIRILMDTCKSQSSYVDYTNTVKEMIYIGVSILYNVVCSFLLLFIIVVS